MDFEDYPVYGLKWELNKIRPYAILFQSIFSILRDISLLSCVLKDFICRFSSLRQPFYSWVLNAAGQKIHAFYHTIKRQGFSAEGFLRQTGGKLWHMMQAGKNIFGMNFAIIGIENQEMMDYSIPLRNMS